MRNPKQPRFHHHEDGKEIDGLPAPALCPFCNSADYGGIVTCDGGPPDTTTYHVTCDSCGAEGPCASSLAEAAELWNKAGGSPTAAALIAMLEERVEAQRDQVFNVQSISLTVARSLDSQTLDIDDANHLERLLRISVDVCEDICSALDPITLLKVEVAANA